MGEQIRATRAHVRLRYPAAYLSVAFALGPLFAWTIVLAAGFLPWTRSYAIDMFTRDPWQHTLPFALACASLAWGLRRRIVNATGREALWSALWCSLLGGPVYLACALIESLILVPGQLTEGIAGILEALILVPLASVVVGGLFGALFLPVTMPLTWGAILFLRLASGGHRRALVAT
jgi:hypothetical protein